MTRIASPPEGANARAWPLDLPWPAYLVAGLMAAVLIAVSSAYGFHRDELYFIVAGRHPAFGYVDQPPLTPLLSAASTALLGVTPMAVRLLPALEMALVAIVTAFIARDLGGSGRARVLAALTVALSGYLAAGHLDDTAEFDLLAWAVVLWLLVRLLAGGDHRLWLVLGVATGIGLENKDTLVFLGAGLAVGLLLARRWDVLRAPWMWSGIAIAIVIWAPNLIWQALNGWPQLAMAQAIAGNAADNRAQFLPLLWLFTGPFLFPVSLVGFAWTLRAQAAAAWRAIGIAAVVAFVLAYASGGKAYYALGSAPVFMAAGAILLDRWLGRGHARLRAIGFAAAAVPSAAFIILLTWPVLPLATYATTTLASVVPDTAEQIGWPQLVTTVRGVVDALPADEQARAMILTSNYGEAGALELLGPGLPPVYSGHNAFWAWGPPPADLSVVVHVGDWAPSDWEPYFTGCHVVATIDDGLAIPNQEQGQAISVCTGLGAPWTVIWPSQRHLS